MYLSYKAGQKAKRKWLNRSGKPGSQKLKPLLMADMLTRLKFSAYIHLGNLGLRAPLFLERQWFPFKRQMEKT